MDFKIKEIIIAFMVLFAVCSEGGIEVAMREKGGRSLASWPWVEE